MTIYCTFEREGSAPFVKEFSTDPRSLWRLKELIEEFTDQLPDTVEEVVELLREKIGQTVPSHIITETNRDLRWYRDNLLLMTNDQIEETCRELQLPVTKNRWEMIGLIHWRLMQEGY